MTLPDQDRPRKPPNRFWLFAPFVLLLAVTLIWSEHWVIFRQKALAALETRAAALRAQGWQASWSSRSFTGWPFRYELDLKDAKLIEPSGRGVSTPLIRAEAYAYAPDKWVAFAPSEIDLQRPGGPVKVTGRVLRAGLTQKGGLYALTLQGEDLILAPAAGAAPFPLRGAKQIIVSLRQGPNDQGAMLFSGKALATTSDAMIGQLTGGKPADLDLELILSHRSALRGVDWSSVWRNWSGAGGAAQVQKATLSAGDEAIAAAPGGQLIVAADGSLAGRLPLDPQASHGVPGLPNLSATPAMTFSGGEAHIGALALPAPRFSDFR